MCLQDHLRLSSDLEVELDEAVQPMLEVLDSLEEPFPEEVALATLAAFLKVVPSCLVVAWVLDTSSAVKEVITSSLVAVPFVATTSMDTVVASLAILLASLAILPASSAILLASSVMLTSLAAASLAVPFVKEEAIIGTLATVKMNQSRHLLDFKRCHLDFTSRQVVQ